MLIKECKHRRKRLMDMMGEDCIAILPTASVQLRNRDVDFQFRPDSDFYYLSGFPEPEALMVLIPNRREGEYLLFCRESDPAQEIWHGRRCGIEKAAEEYEVDDVFPITDIDDILPGLIENKERIYYNMGNDASFDQRVMGWLNAVRKRSRAGINAPDEFISLDHLLHDMRLYKSRHELSTMRRAAKISAQAHIRAMQVCKPGMMEYQVEAELIHSFMQQGSRYAAYPSIVGAGENGCILHYTENEAECKDGDLLLIDAGAELDGYASDITRTFPINGKFTDEQKAVYEIVLAAQLAAIEQVKAGNHWNDPHDAAVRVITEGLVELEILNGNVDTLIEQAAYKPYYMHRTGHWLGMDVHDVGEYKLDGNWRLLEPGMVLTVEPGLYFNQTTKGLDSKWYNIGIRIEDDVVVTKEGNEVLSKDAPKSINDIEDIMANAA